MIPQVSVIIANYNRSQRMRRAVDSVLLQHGVDFELFVVDDASTDPPTELYAELEKRGHQVLRGKRRAGPGPCRNWAAREARGLYLATLDSDDYWLPGKLEAQLSSLKASGLKAGQTDEIWYRDGVEVRPLKAHRIEQGDLFERSLRAICVSPSSAIIERDLFLELGGFDEELFVCEDYDFWLRVAARERFDAVMKPLVVKHGGHQDQLSKLLPAMDRFRLRALCKGLAWGLFGERWPLAQAEVMRKAAILSKGTAKRGRLDAVTLCDRLIQAAEVADWAGAHEIGGRLMRSWPVGPEPQESSGGFPASPTEKSSPSNHVQVRP